MLLIGIWNDTISLLFHKKQVRWVRSTRQCGRMPSPEFPASSPGLQGNAQLRPQPTAAIRRVALIKRQERGTADLPGAIARRARVGNAALCRRWSCKEELVTDLVHAGGVAMIAAEDTCSPEDNLPPFVLAAFVQPCDKLLS